MTPTFPMEIQKEIEEYVNKIVKPIFDRVLQETKSNSMTTISQSFKILWRPNNYRRKLKVKLKDNSTIKQILTAIGSTKEEQLNYNEHTKLISIKNYKGVTIQYGKDTLTGIFSQNIIYGNKETYLIEANTSKELDERIEQKKEDIKKQIDYALNHFIDRFKLRLEQHREPRWDRYEDWIKGEEFIDNIPPETIIHDTFFKKVYPKGIEFIQTKKKEEPTVHLKSYIKERTLEKREPIIAKEINNIYESIIPTLNQLNESILLEIKNKKLHQKVLKSMDKTLKQIRKDMLQRRINDYM